MAKSFVGAVVSREHFRGYVEGGGKAQVHIQGEKQRESDQTCGQTDQIAAANTCRNLLTQHDGNVGSGILPSTDNKVHRAELLLAWRAYKYQPNLLLTTTGWSKRGPARPGLRSLRYRQPTRTFWLSMSWACSAIHGRAEPKRYQAASADDFSADLFLPLILGCNFSLAPRVVTLMPQSKWPSSKPRARRPTLPTEGRPIN
eukprot:6208004-Pleurochrysis_carterae.AAC.1